MKLSDQNWQEAGRIYEKTLARELDDILEERDREEYKSYCEDVRKNLDELPMTIEEWRRFQGGKWR